MPQVKIKDSSETPTQQIIKQAAKPIQVTDARGRVIRLRKPGILAQFKLVEAVGGKAASNEVYMSMVLPLTYIECIDEAVITLPEDKKDVDWLIELLGDDGISAVIDAIKTNFVEQDAAKTKGELKN